MTNDLKLSTRLLLSLQKAGHNSMPPERFNELLNEGYADCLDETERGHIARLYSTSYARLIAMQEERELGLEIKLNPGYSDVVKDVNELLGFYL